MAPFQRYVLLNGKLIESTSVAVSPLSDGFMFGHGLFETVKVKDGRPIFLSRHHARLATSAAALGLTPVSAWPEFVDRCGRLVAANKLSEGSLKAVVFMDTDRPAELLATRNAGYPRDLTQRGFKLRLVGDVRRGGIPGYKTTNYLKNILERREAQQAGYDDALFVDVGGEILEGAATNLFLIKNGVAFTPGANAGILPGIARGVVREILGVDGCIEYAVTKEQLLSADEVFVTNALLGVMPVSAVDLREWDISGFTRTRELIKHYALREAEEG